MSTFNENWPRCGEDGGNVVLGLWLAVSPWALSHAHATTPALNAHIVGVIIAVAATAALLAFKKWEEWVNAAFAVWLALLRGTTCLLESWFSASLSGPRWATRTLRRSRLRDARESMASSRTMHPTFQLTGMSSHMLPAMRGGLPGWLRVGRERELRKKVSWQDRNRTSKGVLDRHELKN